MRWGLLVVLLLLAPLGHAAQLRELRVWESPESTRVVFDLHGVSDPKVFTLSSPERVVVDFDGVDAVSIARAAEAQPKGLVQRIRSGPRGQGIRVVLDVAAPVAARSFALTPTERYGRRVVVDLTVPGGGSQRPPESRSVTPAVPNVAPSLLQDKPLVIAIDAGHGGEDPGAIGKSGLQEKDVALAIARKLALLINTQPGMRAVLTRDGDYYVGLRQRVEFARRHQADMFVSVHCNAFTRRDMRGTAVYVLSDRGATSEHARWLAQKENAADLVGGVDIHDKDGQLAAVLIDLSQSATMEASFDIGGRILKAMGQVNPLQKPDVQQAGFMVLKAPDIPSVLVETAFITNPTEERLLARDAYQNQLAASMLAGIRGYFQSYRPRQQMVMAEPPRAAAPTSRPARASEADQLRAALRAASFTQGVSRQ